MEGLETGEVWGVLWMSGEFWRSLETGEVLTLEKSGVVWEGLQTGEVC